MTISTVVDKLIERSEGLLGNLQSTDDTEERLALIEMFLSEREPLLAVFTEDLDKVEDARRSPEMARLKELDLAIEEQIRAMMNDMDGKLKDLKAERVALLQKKQVNSGYLKPPVSAEGYFIDNKK